MDLYIHVGEDLLIADQDLVKDNTLKLIALEFIDQIKLSNI